MKSWLVSPIFWVFLCILVCLMFWRNKAVPKYIAKWLNRAGAQLQEISANLGACQGMAVYKSISAIVFVFLPAGEKDKFTLKSCSGFIRYGGRFYKSGIYKFILDTQLSEGHVKVILMDKKKSEILKLSPGSFAGQIELNAKDKYYVYWEFYEASGTCELCWETGSTIK